MRLKTMAWRPDSGRSSPWPANLDSPSTLAVMFGGGTAAHCRAAIARFDAAALRAASLPVGPGADAFAV